MMHYPMPVNCFSSLCNLYQPTLLVLVLNQMRVDRARGTVRDHPFNVVVGGDHLEKVHFKRDFLEFDGYAALELWVGPLQILR